jgi:CRP/FNR family cyclic AMP-dependent transcriptional regulator
MTGLVRSVGSTIDEYVTGFVDELSAPDRAALEAVGTVRRYRPGRVLMLEGDRIGHVLILREGRVKVTSTTPDGREVLLAVCGPGELIGEMSALSDREEVCSAAVEALDAVVALVIPREDFVEFVECHPATLLVLARGVVRRLKAADQRRRDFGSYDTPGRVARLLVEMAARYGRETDAGIEIGLPLSQEELAGLITASRESVARALMSFRRLGLIATGRRSIVVRDLDGLRQFSL